MNFDTQAITDKLWTNQEADVITGGQSNKPWIATNIALNSKDIFPGDLFFASKNDDFQQAFDMGAAAIAVSANTAIPEELEALYPFLKVACTFEALRCLAKAARFRTHSLVVSVQGYEQRRSLSNALCSVSDLYEGGRHLSSSLAAMPDDCDFSLFGLSPSLKPDVVVINKPSQMRDLSIFDHMPSHGIILLNNDDPAAQTIMSAAKAAGIKSILTFGAEADAHLVNQIEASNGVQTSCKIFGESIAVTTASDTAPHMPVMKQNVNMLLVGMMLMQLSGNKLSHVAQDMAESYMSAFTMNDTPAETSLSLFKPPAATHQDEAIFRVKNMVDTGQGRRTLILDQGAPEAREHDFALPSKLAGLDVVRAGKKVSIFKNARKAVENILNVKALSPIIPDVLTPGDFVIFKSTATAAHSTFSQALRMENS